MAFTPMNTRLLDHFDASQSSNTFTYRMSLNVSGYFTLPRWSVAKQVQVQGSHVSTTICPYTSGVWKVIAHIAHCHLVWGNVNPFPRALSGIKCARTTFSLPSWHSHFYDSGVFGPPSVIMIYLYP